MENVHSVVSNCPDFIMVFYVSVLCQMSNPLSNMMPHYSSASQRILMGGGDKNC